MALAIRLSDAPVRMLRCSTRGVPDSPVHHFPPLSFESAKESGSKLASSHQVCVPGTLWKSDCIAAACGLDAGPAPQSMAPKLGSRRVHHPHQRFAASDHVFPVHSSRELQARALIFRCYLARTRLAETQTRRIPCIFAAEQGTGAGDRFAGDGLHRQQVCDFQGFRTVSSPIIHKGCIRRPPSAVGLPV